jgi:hypothetical protein
MGRVICLLKSPPLARILSDINRLHTTPSYFSNIHFNIFAGRPRGQSSKLGRGKGFLFSMSSRPVLGPTQRLIQWVPGVERPGHEADHSPPSSADVKNT